MQEHAAAAPLAALEALPVARAMRESLWLYPIVEVVHLVGIAVLAGGVILFDLRVLGFSRRMPVDLLARHVLPWSVAALLLIVPSGLLMFSAHPSDFLGGGVFVVKMALLMLASFNALAFHLGPFRNAAAWSGGAPAGAKAQALASILLWISVIACGRLLAYV